MHQEINGAVFPVPSIPEFRPATEDEYHLTAGEREFIDQSLINAKSLQDQAQGALNMLIKMRGLSGDWSYAGGVLTKVVK